MRGRGKRVRPAPGTALVRPALRRTRARVGTPPSLGIELLKLAAVAGNAYAWVWDIASDRLHWMVPPAGLLGPLPASGRYPDFRDLVHPEDRGRFLATGRAALEEAARTRKRAPYECEFRVVRTDGVVRWLCARGEVLTGPGGKPARMLGVTADVHARRLGEEALARQKDELALIFDSVPAAIGFVDSALRIVALNRRWEALFGIAREQAIGRELREVIGERAWAEAAPQAARALAGESVRYERRLERADGTSRTLLVQYEPYVAPDGASRGFFGLFTDITELKAAQSELAERAAELYAVHKFSVAAAVKASLEEIYPLALDTILNLLGTARTSIMLLDADGVARVKAARGLSASYLQAVEGHFPWPHDATDAAPILVEDALREPTLASYRSLFSAKGIRSLAFIPLSHAGRLLGKFMIYYEAPHRYEKREVELALTIASQLSAAIANARARDEIRSARDELERALESSASCSWEYDLQSGEVRLSRGWAEILGLPPQPVRTKMEELLKVCDPAEVPRLERAASELIRGQRVEYSEVHRVRAVSGAWKWIHSRGRVTRRDPTSGRALTASGTNQDVTERERMRDLLRLVAEGTAAATGEAFLHTLTRTLAQALGVRYAFVGEFVEPARERVRVLSFWNGLEQATPFEYALAGTPCARVLNDGLCVHERGVRERYPEDDNLARLGVESYFGLLARGADGSPVGPLVLMHGQPFRADEAVRQVLQVFAARAGAEIERLRIAAKLEAREALFRSLAEMGSDLYWETDSEHRLVRVGLDGRMARRRSGRVPQLGERRWEVPSAYPDPAGWEAHKAMLEAHLPFRDFEIGRFAEDGTVIHYSLDGDPVFDAAGHFAGYRGLARDITVRKRHEALLALEAEVLESVAANAPLGQTLERLLRRVEREAPGMLASVLLVGDDGTHLVHGAAPSLPPGVRDAYPRVEIGPAQGSCGTAAHRREAVIVEDIATDPLWSELREPALAHGLRACWSAPILDSGGALLGTFAMYWREPRRPAPWHLELVAAAARLAALAIANERVRAALAESEARHRTLVESLPVGIVLHRGGPILLANHEAARILGYRSGAEMPGEDVYARIPPHLREHLRARRRLVEAEGKSLAPIEFRIERPGSEALEVETYDVPLAIGGERAVLSVLRDVTKRKRQREALAKLSAAVEQSPIAILITDAEARIEYVNPAFERMTGHPREAVLGENPRILASGRTPPETYRALWAALGAGEPWQGELWDRRASGEVYLARTTIAPVRDRRGRTTHYIGIQEDITQFRQAQEARAALEAQLREAQKMEALGTLAGGIAHDFNNILAAILGNAELAREELGDHPAQTSIEEVRKAAGRGRELVRQVLAFARRQPTERRPIELAPVAKEAARLMAAALPPGVKLELRCAADAPVVLADPTQIQQVLLNLCANAWQAMRSAGRRGTISVSLGARETPAGRFAELAVRDEGPGMDEATRARIFEPFFTTKPAGEGTGLGLSVVHGIVQAHGGAIEVETAPGAGATFRILLPAVGAAAEAPVEAARAAPVQGGGKHVLYVDDDDALVFLMKRLLERRGFRVSAYADAREALAALAADPAGFDLVVSDYNMPALSGLDVAREVRALRADLPVAVTSGYLSEQLRGEAAAAGVRELIYKPDSAEELCATIARLAGAQTG